MHPKSEKRQKMIEAKKRRPPNLDEKKKEKTQKAQKYKKIKKGLKEEKK